MFDPVALQTDHRIAVLIRNLNPVYSKTGAAKALSISVCSLNNLIEAGEIGTITQGKRLYVTGWDIVQYLERKRAASHKAAEASHQR